MALQGRVPGRGVEPWHGVVMFVVHLRALCLLHIVCDGAACFLYVCCVCNNDALSLKSDTRDIQFLL